MILYIEPTTTKGAIVGPTSRPVMVACLGKDDQGYCFKTVSKRIGIRDELAKALIPILSYATGHRTIVQLANGSIAESTLLTLFSQFEVLGICYEAHHVALYGQRAACYPDPLRIHPGNETVRQLMKLPPDREGELLSVQHLERPTDPLVSRRTQRSFNEKPISFDEMSQIALASYGLTGASGNSARRTVPSAGAMYPLQLDYIVRRGDMPLGLHRWAKHVNAFIPYRQVDDEDLTPCFIGDEWMVSSVI